MRHDRKWAEQKRVISNPPTGSYKDRRSFRELSFVHPTLTAMMFQGEVDFEAYKLGLNLKKVARDPAKVVEIANGLMTPLTFDKRDIIKNLEDAIVWLPRAAELVEEVLGDLKRGRPRGCSLLVRRVAYEKVEELRKLDIPFKEIWPIVYDLQPVKEHLMKSRSKLAQDRQKTLLRNSITQQRKRSTRTALNSDKNPRRKPHMSL